LHECKRYRLYYNPRSPLADLQKSQKFTESVIREMTRLALEHDAVNLAQGFPDFPAPEEVKEAAVQAIRADINQYEITWGAREFRRAVADRFRLDTGMEVDPRGNDSLLRRDGNHDRFPSGDHRPGR